MVGGGSIGMCWQCDEGRRDLEKRSARPGYNKEKVPHVTAALRVCNAKLICGHMVASGCWEER